MLPYGAIYCGPGETQLGKEKPKRVPSFFFHRLLSVLPELLRSRCFFFRFSFLLEREDE
jgi:hypothetical protein